MNQRLLKNGENINSQDITLFCFPFAGGGASTYTSWIKKLKDKITVCPIQLPGREERIMEKPYTDMSELLRDLTDEIVIAIKGKYVLWGHSMGGKIAYELEKYLENKGYQAQCIFASGCRIPNIPEPNPIYHLKDEAFKRELERFGGTPKKVLENKELLDFFLPMLRADFTLADITVEALCNTGGKFEDVAKEFRLLASKSVSERLNALYNIIERPNGELMEHQLKMLNILFRVFSQNFRCVSTYEPKPYYGNMRILCCEIQGGHFYPGFFAEDYETWKPYAKGNLTFDLIKGWHLDCITEPNLGENIKKMLDFNY